MTLIKGSLSRRGVQLENSGQMVDKFKEILADLYDPKTNPTGWCNVGVAENVRMLCAHFSSQSNSAD